jgi:hypothetical protein
MELCNVLRSTHRDNEILRDKVLELEGLLATSTSTIKEFELALSSKAAVEEISFVAVSSNLMIAEERQLSTTEDLLELAASEISTNNIESEENRNSGVTLSVHQNADSVVEYVEEQRELPLEDVTTYPYTVDHLDEALPSYKVDIGFLTPELYTILINGAIFMKKSHVGYKSLKKILISHDLRYLFYGVKGSTKFKSIPLACFDP